MKGIYKDVNDILKKVSIKILGYQYKPKFSTHLKRIVFCPMCNRRILKINIKYVKLHKNDMGHIETLLFKQFCNLKESINVDDNMFADFQYVCECGEEYYNYKPVKKNFKCKCGNIINKKDYIKLA